MLLHVTAAGPDKGAGAGYLHMVYTFNLRGPVSELYAEVGGGPGGGEHTNEFIRSGHSTDWRGAKVTVKLRGEVENTNGASLCLLIQAVVDGICSGYILTGAISTNWNTNTFSQNCRGLDIAVEALQNACVLSATLADVARA